MKNKKKYWFVFGCKGEFLGVESGSLSDALEWQDKDGIDAGYAQRYEYCWDNSKFFPVGYKRMYLVKIGDIEVPYAVWKLFEYEEFGSAKKSLMSLLSVTAYEATGVLNYVREQVKKGVVPFKFKKPGTR